MAPKKKQRTAASSSSASSYDPSRFVSEEAFHRYNESIVKRTIVKERGLQLEDATIDRVVTGRKWEELVKQPEAGVVPLVHEFYANAAEAVNQRAVVRGKTVKYDRTTINKIYGLPNIEDNEFHQYLEDPDLDEVISKIARPGAAWKCTRGVQTRISRQDLDKFMRAWQYFISAKLMPTTHLSDVTKERAVLLFCIVEGKTVDVGSIIEHSINRSIKSSTTCGLCHPSLITVLCREAGVIWGKNEVLIHPQRVIDHRLLPQFKSWSDAGAHIQEADNEAQSSDSLSPSHTVQTEQMKIQQQLQQTHRKRVEQFMEYQLAFNSYMATCMAQMNIGTPPPPPPVLTAYPPENESDKEAEEENEDDDKALGADPPDAADAPPA